MFHCSCSTVKVTYFRTLLLLIHRAVHLILGRKMTYFSNADSSSRLPSLNSMLEFCPSVYHDKRHHQSHTELISKLRIKLSLTNQFNFRLSSLR
jgi:hypothetical protein